jgi:uncharacterized protein with HEPN domain
MRREKRNPERDSAWLFDNLSAAEAILVFVEGRDYQTYQSDMMLKSAVERQVEIIGEAVRNLSSELKGATTHVPWGTIERQRHKLAHDYFEIRDPMIWKVATIDVPELIKLIRPLLPKLPIVPKTSETDASNE